MISAYIKPTNRCTVGCSHCYLPESVRLGSERMSADTLRSAAVFLAEMQAMARHEGTFVIWHGGEPLVMSPDWYFRAGEVLDEVLPGHRETMQTSLIPFREEFVELVKARFNSFLGSSVDFSQRRLGGSVEAYHELFMRKVDLARENGIRVSPGVVPSTHDLGREREMVGWFVDRDFASFNIDRYNAYEAHFPDRPDNAQHSAFLSGLLDALLGQMEKTGKAPYVGAIAGGINGVLHGVGGDRWGGSCMSDFVVVEPDGSLNNCPDKASVEAPFGVVGGGYKAFAADRFRRNWVRHQQIGHQNPYCAGCENLHFCKTGCPITPNTPETEGGECSGYKRFLTHVREVAARDGGRAALEAYLRQRRPRDETGSAYDQALAATDRSAGSACAA